MYGATKDGVGVARMVERVAECYNRARPAFSMGVVSSMLAGEYAHYCQIDQAFADEWLTGVFLSISKILKRRGIRLDLNFIRQDRRARRASK